MVALSIPSLARGQQQQQQQQQQPLLSYTAPQAPYATGLGVLRTSKSVLFPGSDGGDSDNGPSNGGGDIGGGGSASGVGFLGEVLGVGIVPTGGGGSSNSASYLASTGYPSPPLTPSAAGPLSGDDRVPGANGSEVAASGDSSSDAAYFDPAAHPAAAAATAAAAGPAVAAPVLSGDGREPDGVAVNPVAIAGHDVGDPLELDGDERFGLEDWEVPDFIHFTSNSVLSRWVGMPTDDLLAMVPQPDGGGAAGGP